jgi:soluble lytic murein transglycosylase-like protein
MKVIRNSLWMAFCVVAIVNCATAQSARPYRDMSAAERATFVSTKAKEIARRVSDSEYQFTASFETQIQAGLDGYSRRLEPGENSPRHPRHTIERGQKEAAAIMTAFKARGVSPILGLYLAWIESAYKTSAVSEAGSLGMFQFMPQTGLRFGLTSEDLLDVNKSADGAARYLTSSMKKFENDKMKEALALLAYNRGEDAVQKDLDLRVNKTNNQCSVCVLTEPSAKNSAKSPDAGYLPAFFAAAIFGENPQAFGLSSPPLSSFGTGN